MERLEDFLDTIENEEHKKRTAEMIDWIRRTFPELGERIAWSNPAFTHHGTFILSLSLFKSHMSISPEQAGIERFARQLEAAGYEYGKMTFRLPWNLPVNYDLLREIIAFNLEDKKDIKTYWRKPED
ncbi:iron chaperone [Proteiniclasticum sp. QWL-01]|uniref:iron chaperone n=1 Tax=Proteiniclasticum sp. QWL-01 TaxID=3036945 RepID=UPI00241052BB|nr:iron chaperone [Proteiniclasticum sp. QWL-01]WFF72175.1 iron chaperone [Proteiniclasticum sp. QWL-01]